MNFNPWVAVAVLALLVFWSIGAHNRLVALRGKLVRAWSAVDEPLRRRLVALPQLVLAVRTAADVKGSSTEAPVHAVCDAVVAALGQVQAAADAVRAAPLRAERMASLVAAQEALGAAMERFMPRLDRRGSARRDEGAGADGETEAPGEAVGRGTTAAPNGETIGATIGDTNFDTRDDSSGESRGDTGSDTRSDTRSAATTDTSDAEVGAADGTADGVQTTVAMSEPAPVLVDDTALREQQAAVAARAEIDLVALREQPEVMALLQELQDAQGRLDFARQAFNDAAQAYNAAVVQFPTRLLGPLFGFVPAGVLS